MAYVASAFYSDIKSIDTVYNVDITYSPYMLVTKMDNSKFKVCVPSAHSTGGAVSHSYDPLPRFSEAPKHIYILSF